MNTFYFASFNIYNRKGNTLYKHAYYPFSGNPQN